MSHRTQDVGPLPPSYRHNRPLLSGKSPAPRTPSGPQAAPAGPGQAGLTQRGQRASQHCQTQRKRAGPRPRGVGRATWSERGEDAARPRLAVSRDRDGARGTENAHDLCARATGQRPTVRGSLSGGRRGAGRVRGGRGGRPRGHPTPRNPADASVTETDRRSGRRGSRPRARGRPLGGAETGKAGRKLQGEAYPAKGKTAAGKFQKRRENHEVHAEWESRRGPQEGRGRGQ